MDLNTCCATIVLPNFGAGTHPLPIPFATIWSLQFKIGSTTIVGLIGFTPLDNPLSVASIQAKIDANLIYQTSGTTVTVDSLDSNGLTVTVCKPSTTQITDDAEGIFSVEQS